MKVLLIEDDPEHAELIKAHIMRRHRSSVQIQWVSRLSLGLERLEKNGLDVILLDLGLPDSTMDKTLDRVLPKAKGIPIVVLSSLEDEDMGVKAIHQGAQNYICKSWMDGELLFRSLRYAIERHAVEQELRRANRTKDEFLATLSHELRTPINVIHGFAEVLQQGNLSLEEQSQALDAIVRNAKLQVSLINDMLDMSSVITGKLVLNCVSLNLISIINEVIEAVNLAAKGKRITLKTLCDTSVGLIYGDPTRIHQILWNLLSNAIKFSPVGGIVEVRLKQSGSNAEIDVEDWGSGIDSHFLPFVFDRFSQQDTSIRRQYSGLGLGLSIVKYLVELHGGKASAVSAGVGKGATFTVSFPLLESEILINKPNSSSQLVEIKSGAESLLGVSSKEITLKGIHVLVIDDSEDSLILTKVLLQRAGATVTVANSSYQALSKFEQIVPDVIVCDIGMPDEDGYTFLRKWRERELQVKRKPTPATALTAYTRESEKLEAKKAGFQSHLSKPVEQADLVSVIQELNKGKKSES